MTNILKINCGNTRVLYHLNISSHKGGVYIFETCVNQWEITIREVFMNTQRLGDLYMKPRSEVLVNTKYLVLLIMTKRVLATTQA